MIKQHITDETKLTDPEFSLNRIKRSLRKLKVNSHLNLKPIIARCLSMVTSVIMKKSSRNLVKHSFELYLDLQTANFKKHESNNQYIEVIINDSKYQLSSSDAHYSDLYFDYFIYLSVLNIVSRDKECISHLNLKSINHKPHEFWLLGTSYLEALENNNQDLVYKIFNELEEIAKTGKTTRVSTLGTNTTVYDSDIAVLYQLVWFPIFRLYDYVNRNKVNEFNTEMEMYLSKKKKYIEEKEMTDYQIYWIDIPLLGCLTYAISKGFKITVETEYAPRWVYEITNI